MSAIKLSKRLLGVTAALILAQALSACGAAGDAGGETPASEAAPAAQSSAVEGISGELLASVKVSDKHAVDFFDFGEGLLGAHEMMPIGVDSVLDRFADDASLEEIFASLQPGVAMPAALTKAQLRADAYNLEHPSVGPVVDRTLNEKAVDNEAQLAAPSSVSVRAEAAGQVGSSEQVGSVKQAATSCSSDVYGDQWGAQWFLNNMCNEGCFRHCHTNQLWRAVSTTKNWFRWKSMNGDFNVTARSRGWRVCSICAADETIWSYNIQPRQSDNWKMTGGHEKGGRIDSQCGHGHAAGLTCD
jgi:hypothetical protein